MRYAVGLIGIIPKWTEITKGRLRSLVTGPSFAYSAYAVVFQIIVAIQRSYLI